MIKIYIPDTKYRHDIFELVRSILDTDDIDFIDNLEDINNYKNLLKIIYNNKNIECELYSFGNRVKYIKEDINDLSDIEYDYNRTKTITEKRAIYKILIDISDEEIPWGILTGIRPMKILHNMDILNIEDSRIKNIFKYEYMIADKKIDLMMEILEIQRQYIYPLDDNRYSLYIAIPFCPSICSYCSFPSFRIGDDYNRVKKYIETLLYEIKQTSIMMKDKILNTIYIGGGTPSSIDKEDLRTIIRCVKDNFDLSELKEFTVEAGRPDTLNKDYLLMLKEEGIDRISINPQTMNDRTLKRVKRSHNVDSVIKIYNLANDVGFDIINMDIILGLPGEDKEDIENTMIQLKNLNPKNLTIHTLAMKRGSKLYNKNYIDDLDGSIDILELKKMLDGYLLDMNLKPYYMYRQKQAFGNIENIGYSKRDKESIYNIAMMEERETIIGLGLGSVTKIYNGKDNYIKRIPSFKGLLEYNTRIDETINKRYKNIIR